MMGMQMLTAWEVGQSRVVSKVAFSDAQAAAVCPTTFLVNMRCRCTPGQKDAPVMSGVRPAISWCTNRSWQWLPAPCRPQQPRQLLQPRMRMMLHVWLGVSDCPCGPPR